MEQIKHSIAIGGLQPGDQLPALRSLAETLVINPNTVAKVYRELEHEGVLELRHGAGAFVTERRKKDIRIEVIQSVQPHFQNAVQRAREAGLSEEQMRTLFENEVLQPAGNRKNK